MERQIELKVRGRTDSCEVTFSKSFQMVMFNFGDEEYVVDAHEIDAFVKWWQETRKL